MNDQYITNLVDKIKGMLEAEYKLIDYSPSEYKEKEKTISDYDAKKFQYKLNNPGFNNNGNVKDFQQENSDIDIINCMDVFNIVKDQSSYMEWRELDEETKIKILDSFIEKNKEAFYITDQDATLLRTLVRTNKINYKKYIEYDKINGQIISLPILTVNESEQSCLIELFSKKKVKKMKNPFEYK